jgi:bifunctional NMN adenylyltransferase/nudix hydrolase
MSNDGTQVLLGKKHHATAWRFPGGFADPTDTDYEEAAKRELQEECGDIKTTAVNYIGSAKIDDWRYRSEADKIITLLFKTTLVSGIAKANDDLGDVAWFPVAALQEMAEQGAIVKEHLVLINLLLKNIH